MLSLVSKGAACLALERVLILVEALVQIGLAIALGLKQVLLTPRCANLEHLMLLLHDFHECVTVPTTLYRLLDSLVIEAFGGRFPLMRMRLLGQVTALRRAIARLGEVICANLLGRVQLISVDSEAVEELEARQLAQDEVDLILARQTDEEHLESASSVRQRRAVEVLVLAANQAQRLDDLGEGLRVLRDLVPVQVDGLQHGEVAAAELQGQGTDHIV